MSADRAMADGPGTHRYSIGRVPLRTAERRTSAVRASSGHKSHWHPTPPARFMRFGMLVHRTAVENGFISHRQRPGAQRGRRGRMCRELDWAWSTLSRQLSLECRAMYASHGWIRALSNWDIRTIGCGTRFTAHRRTVARVGAGSRSSLGQSVGTTTSFLAASAFPSETTSALRSTATVRPTPCGVKAETTSRPDLSGIPADGNRLVITPIVKCDQPDVWQSFANYVNARLYCKKPIVSSGQAKYP